MLSRIKNAAKILLKGENASRHIVTLEDDTFVVSYPKSGNTWTRFLIANLMYQDEEVSFRTIERLVPDIYQRGNNFLRTTRRPRLLKSHEYFDPRYKRVLYIARDPRDIVVSYWYYHVKLRIIDENYSMDEFVDRFIVGDLDPFGTWEENVGSWLGARKHHPNFLLIRYEDLRAKPLNELQKVARFLDLQKNEKEICLAIDRSSIDRMKKMEKEGGRYWKPLKKARDDIPFVRQGALGGWKNCLPDITVRKIERNWGHLLIELGYSISGTK